MSRRLIFVYFNGDNLWYYYNFFVLSMLRVRPSVHILRITNRDK